MLQRLSGSGGLAAAIVDDVLKSREPAVCARTLLVFDFDRTLTNGISSPGDETEIAKVVRGGEATVAALRSAHEAGAGLYIITARRPSRLTVEQLFASLDGAQAELSPFFSRGDGPPAEFQFATESGSVPLARGGAIYAADYEKAAALAHIVRERRQEGLRVFFFDDSVVNSYVVGTSTAKHLRSDEKARLAELTSYWWDTFEEETGPSPSMGMSSFGTTDSNYAPHLRHMLTAFGLTSAECDARVELYRNKGNKRNGLQRSKISSRLGVGTDELASVEAASKVSRANMSGLAGVLGARFARGPRPPSAQRSGVPKSHQSCELDANKPSRGGGARAAAIEGLGDLFGARGPPRFRPPAIAGGAASGGWRAQAALKRERAKAATALFEGQSAASLPPGPLSAPRWETAFQVTYPAEGTTGGLAFIATLAGAYAIKSASDVAEEWFGTRFLQECRVPVPEVRVVFPHDAEHASILAAVEAVAKQYSRRGDAEGATGVMVHVYCALCKFNGPLLLLELVPAATSLGQIGNEQRASALLEPSVVGERARARLEAIGRVWVVDAALNFRDRFASRLSYPDYDSAVEYAEGRAQCAPSGNVIVDDNRGSSAPSLEQTPSWLVGNLDNMLLTDVSLAGGGCESAVVTAGAAAIDSHVKIVRGDAAALAPARARAAAHLREELGALLTEARSAAASEGLAVAPSQCLGWLRFTVKAVSGHTLSDGALAAARLGALHGVAAVPGAVAWARSELAAARRGAFGDAKFAVALARVDEDALVEVGRSFESLLAEHADWLGNMPRPALTSGEDGGNDMAPVRVGSALRTEAGLVGAHPQLWAALSEGLRKALLDERVRGLPTEPHSIEWPGWEDGE